jgi:hypothetical protein
MPIHFTLIFCCIKFKSIIHIGLQNWSKPIKLLFLHFCIALNIIIIIVVVIVVAQKLAANRRWSASC